MGAAPGPEAHRRARRGRGGAVRHGRGRARDRARVDDRVRVLDRELAPAARRGAVPHALQRGAAAARGATSSTSAGVRVRFIGRRGGRVPAPGAPAHRGHRGAHRPQPAHDAHVRVQLRRPGRARRRGARRSRPRCGRGTLDPRQDRRAHDRAATSTRPTCPIPTCSCARRASTASRTTCCGRSAYSELVFTDVLWPDFRRAGPLRRDRASSSAATAASAPSTTTDPLRIRGVRVASIDDTARGERATTLL